MPLPLVYPHSSPPDFLVPHLPVFLLWYQDPYNQATIICSRCRYLGPFPLHTEWRTRYTAWGSARGEDIFLLLVFRTIPTGGYRAAFIHFDLQPHTKTTRLWTKPHFSTLSACRRPPRSPGYELRLSHQNDGWHGGLDYLLAQHVVPYVHFPIPLPFDDEFPLGAPNLKTWHVPQSSWGVALAAWPANAPYSVLFFRGPIAC